MWFDDSYMRPQANNLTLVRFVLASAVILSHCYWRAYGAVETDDFSWFLGHPVSYFAVDGFFFLSGFLVYGSLLKRSDPWSFAKARLARLWPGLAVSVAAVVIGGAFLTQVDLAHYWFGYTAHFIWSNLALQSGAYLLTGVKCGAELCSVNGSLWTIAWEVRCYILLVILAVLGLSGRRVMLTVVLPSTFLFALVWHFLPWSNLPAQGLLYYIEQTDRLWTMFALGIAAYILRDRLYLSWWIALALLGAAVVDNQFNLHLHLGGVFIGYAVLCGGFLSARKGAISGNWPDYSYGMYIYAFPVMMLLAGNWTFANHWWLSLANLICTVPLAALSWHFVEKPVLDLMRRRAKRSVEATA